MAHTYILPPRGSFYKYTNSEGNGPIWKLSPSVAITGEGVAMLIDDVRISGSDVFAKNVCFGDKRILGVTGKDFGETVIRCKVLLGDGSKAESVIKTITDYIENNRVSKKFDIIKLSSGDSAFEFVLTEYAIGDLNNDLNIMTLMLKGISFK